MPSMLVRFVRFFRTLDLRLEWGSWSIWIGPPSVRAPRSHGGWLTLPLDPDRDLIIPVPTATPAA